MSQSNHDNSGMYTFYFGFGFTVLFLIYLLFVHPGVVQTSNQFKDASPAATEAK